MPYWEHNDAVMHPAPTSFPTGVSVSKEQVASASDLHGSIVMGPRGSGEDEAEGAVLLAKPKAKTKRPPFYKVLLLNDDYTPMEFVVSVLEGIFHKSHSEAVEVMLTVHTKGRAIVGRYTKDVAETKIDQVVQYARMNDYPLQCVMEKE